MSNTNNNNNNVVQLEQRQDNGGQEIQQQPMVLDAFEDDWYNVNAEFDKLKNTPENQKEDKKKAIAESLFNAIQNKALVLGIKNDEGFADLDMLFDTNNVAFNKLSGVLAGKNIRLSKNSNNTLTMKIGNGQEGLFIIGKKDDGNLYYRLDVDEVEEKKKKDDPKKKETNWLPIILILVAVTLIGLITLFLVLKNKKDKEEKRKLEQQENDAENELDNGVPVDTGKREGTGEYKPSETETFKNADGEVIKLAEETTYKDGVFSDKAKMAVDIENNPNYSYAINGRQVINPQASYVNGKQTITFYDIRSKSEITWDVDKIKSFTCNGADVDKKTIDLMCSYTREPSGSVSFEGTNSVVQIDKDNGALNVELYTKDGNLISTYSKDNIIKNGNNNYGYTDKDVFYEFPDNIQDAISDALDNIKSDYPDINLNSFKGYEINK